MNSAFLHKAIFLGMFGIFMPAFIFAQSLQIHILYGSKPHRACKPIEGKWFGGKWGGHVGLSVENGPILSFFPKGKLHLKANNQQPNSKFAQHDEAGFYAVFGSELDSVKRAKVTVPINDAQHKRFDSISAAYLQATPYDYAFWGMRCAAAAYEILDQLDLVKEIHRKKVFRKVFYPRVFRRRIFKEAIAQGWKIEKWEGSACRKWDWR